MSVMNAGIMWDFTHVDVQNCWAMEQFIEFVNASEGGK